MSDDLLNELLAKPVGPTKPQRVNIENELTKRVEIERNNATIEVRAEEGSIDAEGTALEFLEGEGLSPEHWEVSGFSKSQYGSTERPMESVKFSYKRKVQAGSLEIDIDELLAAVRDYSPVPTERVKGEHGFLVLIGDMQFGKIDGDGPAGTLARTIASIDAAAVRLERMRLIYDIGHIHIAWLGDHIEGFVSQGGANTWRTQLTLNEQIRLTRRVMLYAMQVFAPLADKVTMAAVPGNHGETVRFAGKGITRYDDSHDTEALIAISDVASQMPEQFGHVDFYVPQTDELIVITEVANTVIAHHHGHKWTPNKQFVWWGQQAFNRESAMQQADILVAGHLHHEHFESEGDRTFWGINALESDSTWFRHNRGTGGSPGIHVGVVANGRVHMRETIHCIGEEVAGL